MSMGIVDFLRKQAELTKKDFDEGIEALEETFNPSSTEGSTLLTQEATSARILKFNSAYPIMVDITTRYLLTIAWRTGMERSKIPIRYESKSTQVPEIQELYRSPTDKV